MTITDWLAIYGAAASTLAGAWAFYQWWTRGPMLQVTASANMVIMGDDAREGRTFIMVSVKNRGTDSTTITNVGLVAFDTWPQRWRRRGSFNAVVNHSWAPYPLPGNLPVGGEWRSLCEQTENLEKLAKEKLLYAWITHTFSDRPSLARVMIKVDLAPPSSDTA